ncbi:iron complex outermembrane recepter protein [Acinetobacter marinus]|uniref:Iron complex outermembrane recepter protein n=1 Tax=Acinetobacter marinus TaxID=281375 RepID=A0A1G6JV37_9GAMM|nr:TonB-dependent siderophore receptor [Acinetobacter marinus]SDC22567.1 iron complex outermembrane recepter protein [Acinetobacter marinus]
MRKISMLSPLSVAIKHSIFIGLSLSSVVVFAEDTVNVLPTIVVETYDEGKIAQNSDLGILGEKSLIDTPFSILTYTPKGIEDQQASTVAEVLKNDPSIRATTNSGHMMENLTIRGFEVNHDEIALNGQYGMQPFGNTPTDLLDSVTVIKGPNALVSGMSPTGGVGGKVSANTKRATEDLTEVSASIEDGGYYKSGFDIARRLGEEDQFGIRTSAYYGDGEHVIEGMEDTNVSGIVALDYTTDKLKINFDAFSVKQDRQGGSPAMISLAAYENQGTPSAPEGDTNYLPYLFGHIKSNYVGLSGEYKFSPDFKVYAGGGYAEKSHSGQMFGTRVNYRNGAYSINYYDQPQTEIDVTANMGFEGKFNTGAIQHTVGLRADYLSQESFQYQTTGSSSALVLTDIYTPNTTYAQTTSPDIYRYDDNQFVSYALTDQMSMLDDKLQVILGARYQDMDIKNHLTNTSYSGDRVSPSAAIVVKPFGEDFSIYTSYVEGLTNGGTVGSAYVNEGEVLDPYVTKQYEVGAKYQSGSWLNTLAIYQIEKAASLVETRSDGDYLTQDGEQRSRGVEWTLTGDITRDLSILGSLAYIDAEYTKAASNEGNDVLGIPHFTAGLTLNYDIPFVEGLSVNTHATYVGEQYLNQANTIKLPDYTIVDLGAKYETSLGGVGTTFRVGVDNITDKNYWAGVFGNNYAIIGEGRTYTAGVTFNF